MTNRVNLKEYANSIKSVGYKSVVVKNSKTDFESMLYDLQANKFSIQNFKDELNKLKEYFEKQIPTDKARVSYLSNWKNAHYFLYLFENNLSQIMLDTLVETSSLQHSVLNERSKDMIGEILTKIKTNQVL